MRKDIAKITDTMLGTESHGIFTCYLTVDYGGSGQSVGGYSLDTPIQDENGKHAGRIGTGYGMEFIIRVMRACGVSKWEDVKGRTIFVLQDLEPDALALGTAKVLGIENLPTEKGEQFIFADLAKEFLLEGEALV